ncbi:MAG: cadmium-translocating P-type ATPase [Clostridia bacterium]|nr:cadmium-translocating P-type ATPase [Clostridia bacterium]
MNKKQKRILFRIIFSFSFCLLVSFFSVSEYIHLILYIIPYLIIGYDILRDAVLGVINKQPFDENFLMAIATVGAFALGEYTEAVFVILFYQLGELFQSYAVGKSRNNIAKLMEIRPDYANVENENGELIKIYPDELSVGDIIYVKPGELIPVDAVIEEGSSFIDTVALTGESVPQSVTVGDSVLSGSVNLKGLLKLKVAKAFDESTASKILELVENASSKKAKAEKFISKFAHIYTPAVCGLSFLLGLFVPLLILIITGNNTFGDWIYRALTFLVISCPCALVVSIPLTFFASIGGAGKCGILVKGANYLEALSTAEIAVFDKTGTLTKGVFEVVDIYSVNYEKNELLEYAVLAEIYSNHPISESLRKSYSKPLDKSRNSCFTEISGFGVSAKIDNFDVLVGNAKLMISNNIDFIECDKIGTVVYVAIDNKFAGYIVISDVLKDNAFKAINSIRELGVDNCVMLTGDRKAVGENVAETLGFDKVFAELLPGDKVSVVESLIQNKKKEGSLIFVGDGINDAPVLARADIGVAMGALGSDAAIEAADVVIMDDDPAKISKAIHIAKKCMRIVYQNIYFAIGIKIIFLLLGAFGLTNMWFAIFSDVGVMVIAVLNSVRALKV